jgi:hypothetical protein
MIFNSSSQCDSYSLKIKKLVKNVFVLIVLKLTIQFAHYHHFI